MSDHGHRWTHCPPWLAARQPDLIRARSTQERCFTTFRRTREEYRHPGAPAIAVLIRGPLMNGWGGAAEYLVQRGAAFDFAEAACVGRLDVVKRSVPGGIALTF